MPACMNDASNTGKGSMGVLDVFRSNDNKIFAISNFVLNRWLTRPIMSQHACMTTEQTQTFASALQASRQRF